MSPHLPITVGPGDVKAVHFDITQASDKPIRRATSIRDISYKNFDLDIIGGSGAPQQNLSETQLSAMKADASNGNDNASSDDVSSVDELLESVERRMANRFEALALRLEHMKHMSNLKVEDGDTLVFLDSVTGQVDDSDTEADIYCEPITIRSQSLLKTKSSRFKRMFSPEAQKRIRRKRKVDTLPEGIHYVLDLTPPVTDDDAVILIASLSTPPVVRAWAFYKEELALPIKQVPGIDRDEMGARLGRYLPPEYTVSRHLESISSVLRALEGLPTDLDTACDLWTFFGVANYFECADYPIIADRIFAWLHDKHNEFFLKAAPDLCLIIGGAIRSSVLYQRAFSILVGEEALSIVTPPDAPYRKAGHTIQGRPKYDVDDIDVNRIEYASKALVERITKSYKELVSLAWVDQLPIFRELQLCTDLRRDIILSPAERREAQEARTRRIEGLEAYKQDMKKRVLAAVNSKLRQGHEPLCGTTYSSSGEPRNMDDVYMSFDVNQKLMVRDFWRALHEESFRKPMLYVSLDGKAHDPSKWSAFAYGEDEAFMTDPITGSFVNDDKLGYSHMDLQQIINETIHSSLTPFSNRKEVTELFLSNPSWFDQQVLIEITDYVTTLALAIEPPAWTLEDSLIIERPVFSTTLHQLTDGELKYMPIWADGFDDDSGGVFENSVADEQSFQQQSDVAEMDWDMVRDKKETTSALSDASSYTEIGQSELSTANAASRVATAGYATSGVRSLADSDITM